MFLDENSHLKKQKIIFIDELPWKVSTKKSELFDKVKRCEKIVA